MGLVQDRISNETASCALTPVLKILEPHPCIDQSQDYQASGDILPHTTSRSADPNLIEEGRVIISRETSPREAAGPGLLCFTHAFWSCSVDESSADIAMRFERTISMKRSSGI